MTQRTFYYWLDPLRALSALLVLMVHTRCMVFSLYADLVPSSQNLFTLIFFLICGLGGFSVCMFYILSGFLVGGRTIDKAQKGIISPKRFFLDRLFRIGVPLSGALILIVIVNTLLGYGVDYMQLFGQYTGLQGVVFQDYGGVFWTLPYEIWFYAITLALIIILQHKRRAILGVAIFALSLVVFTQLRVEFLFIISLGIVSYLLKDHRLPKGVLTALWLFLPVVFILYILSHTNYFARHWLSGTILHLINCATQILLFASIAVIVSQYVTRPPKSKIAQWVNIYGKRLATFSYSLFLTHYQVLKIWQSYGHVYNEVSLRSIACFVGLCITCLIVAYLFYWIFERNTVKVQRAVEHWLKLN